MSDPLVAAVIGAGFMGGMHARVLAQMPTVRLKTVVDIRADAAGSLAAETGAASATDIAAVAEDPQIGAVVLALPDRQHVDAAVRLLEAGKAVLLEKPMAHDLPGAQAIAAAAEAGRLMVGHICRFDPRYRQAAEIARRIGPPLHVSASRFCQHPGARAVGSHLCWLMAVHDIDLVQWLTGRRAVSAYACARRDLIPEHRVGVDDVLFAILELDGGGLAQIAAGWTLPAAMPTGLQAGLRLVAEAGMVEVRETDEAVLAVAEDRVRMPDVFHWPSLGERIGGNLRLELDHFVEATRSGAPYLVPVADALAAVAVTDAILASLASGRKEEVARI